MKPRRVGFSCSRHRRRSPAAASVFADRPYIEVDSAGLADGAETPLSADPLVSADLIAVIDGSYRRRLRVRYGAHLRGKRVVCLDIPDRYDDRQPERVGLPLRKAGPLLR